MKFAIQFFLLLCLLLCGSCSNKQKEFQPKATNDHKIAIIGSANGSTEIVISEDSCKQDKDTVIYEIPQCLLWYTKALSEANKGKEIRMWTEHEGYLEGLSWTDDAFGIDKAPLFLLFSFSSGRILSFTQRQISFG